MILKAGEFTVSYLPFAFADRVAAMGRVSGRSVDKAKRFGLTLARPTTLRTPWVAEAYVAVECSLVDRHHFGDQTLLVGEVQALHRAEDAFDEDGVVRIEAVRPLVYLGSQRFATIEVDSVCRQEGES